MARSSGRLPRLYLDQPFGEGALIEPSPDQAHYLLKVLRISHESPVLVFNGRDGEWHATLSLTGKRSCKLRLDQQTWPQQAGPDIHYLFAPLKRARLDYMVQKATELGARRLLPVLTEYTQLSRLNLERMRANAIEAAEQCGLVSVPDIAAPVPLTETLESWSEARDLVYCDEAAELANPIGVLERLQPGPKAVLVGPEGGFSASERNSLLAKPFVTAISLGPRIMRSDTAAIAAFALVNAVHGDWN